MHLRDTVAYETVFRNSRAKVTILTIR